MSICTAEKCLQGSYERFVDHLECPTGISATVRYPGMIISFLAMTLRGRGRGPEFNIIMTLNFLK